jgi:hypothetical protein
LGFVNSSTIPQILVEFSKLCEHSATRQGKKIEKTKKKSFGMIFVIGKDMEGTTYSMLKI